MKTSIRVFVVTIIFALVMPACAGTQPPQTPAPNAATSTLRTLDTTVVVIGDLQSAAIALNRNGVLDDRTATTIVTYTVAALKTLRNTPEGWRQTVIDGYGAMKQTLTAEQRTRLQVVLLAADGAIDALKAVR